MRLRLVSHILRISHHLEAPRGIGAFPHACWKARQSLRHRQGAAGARLWGSVTPGLLSVNQPLFSMFGPIW